MSRFGISTHLMHGERLGREHLAEVARQGFEIVEVFATRTHFAYHDPAAALEVRRWLDDLGLTAWSLHAPICDGFTNNLWGRAYSNATSHAASRQEAVDETRRSVDAARALGCAVVVLHLGIPRGQPIPPDDNEPRALRQSLEAIGRFCAEAGVRLALEVIPNDLATPAALLAWLGDDLDLDDAGVCLDFGHAHLVGGAPEAVETLSGHIITTHVHDNRGKGDDHLVPFDGTIDWHETLIEMSKVGYGGPYIFEVPDHGDRTATLARMVGARRRLQAILDEVAAPFDFPES